MTVLLPLRLLPALVILILASTSEGRCVYGSYRRMPDGYNIKIDSPIRSFPITGMPTEIECADRCLAEKYCRYWKHHRGHCKLTHAINDKISISKYGTSESNSFYQTGADDAWFEVYFLKAGSGITSYESFVGSNSYLHERSISCNEDRCQGFLRASIINAWNDLPIKMVKLSLFKSEKEMVSVIFNGVNSTIENWFSQSRIISSSWEDLYAINSADYLSLKPFPRKSFYAGHSLGTCIDATGWINIMNEQAGCPWEWNKVYPHMMYSNKPKAVKWSQGYGVADSLAVYIQF